MKKDILFLCQFFYPEHNSSATLPFDTAAHLAASGYTVDALCGYPKEYCNEKNVPMYEEKAGIGIRRIRYIQMGRGKRLSRLINYFSFTASVALRLFKFRKYKSVVVYSNPPILPFVAVMANRLFGTKLVFVAYDLYPEVAYASGNIQAGSFIDRGMRKINQQMYQRASCVVALTDEMKDYIVKSRNIDPERVTTIANWAHEKKTAPTQQAFERFGYAQDQYIVSYFGNMGICQEMQTLMNAAQNLKTDPQIRFLIVGHGSKKEQLREQIREHELDNVQLLDFLTGEDFENAVAISSCCVVSLEKGLKGLCAPSKYYSYLQGGKPVLAVVEDGSYLQKEIESEKIGRAITIGDTEDLCHVIGLLAENKAICADMSGRAQALYNEKYAIHIGTEKYRMIFDEILAEK